MSKYKLRGKYNWFNDIADPKFLAYYPKWKGLVSTVIFQDTPPRRGCRVVTGSVFNTDQHGMDEFFLPGAGARGQSPSVIWKHVHKHDIKATHYVNIRVQAENKKNTPGTFWHGIDPKNDLAAFFLPPGVVFTYHRSLLCGPPWLALALPPLWTVLPCTSEMDVRTGVFGWFLHIL